MIHIFNDPGSKFCWRVWTDCDEDPETGRCIGIGKTKSDAIADGLRELQEDLDMLRRLGTEAKCESQPSKNPSPVP